jgi:hypothetical protein
MAHLKDIPVAASALRIVLNHGTPPEIENLRQLVNEQNVINDQMCAKIWQARFAMHRFFMTSNQNELANAMANLADALTTAGVEVRP